jgi:superfamily I DNA and/or RNA helicase
VTSTSHKAIHNLLDEVERAGLAVRGLKKSSSGNSESVYESEHITSKTDVAAFLDAGEERLTAGTAWLFAREELDGALDYLFVDEAGQVSLADALAMGTCARTIVLLGDPVQLAQVTQGIHPEGSGLSVLEHLLDDRPTIPEDRGLFLEHSFRMHPDVCRFVSDAFYEGRLESAEVCVGRTTGLGTGLRFLAVEHEGNSTSSDEEAARIAAELQRLRAAGVAESDALVVAPFNAQVRLLRERLPVAVRVGTVDKFQGQEASVVFFSMASSSASDAPRGIDFLMSRNRLNVAVSRAQCLAYLVCAPRLLEADCRTIEQMRLANALCRFVELAEEVA